MLHVDARGGQEAESDQARVSFTQQSTNLIYGLNNSLVLPILQLWHVFSEGTGDVPSVEVPSQPVLEELSL